MARARKLGAQVVYLFGDRAINVPSSSRWLALRRSAIANKSNGHCLSVFGTDFF